MSKSKILIQFDPDVQTSTFDSIVAIDAGVEHLFRHNAVTPAQIEGLVHGAIFTRGVPDLKSTALFFGGSNVEASEALVAKAKSSFFGPMRVSLMSDPNGSNTTAAAAVISAQRHIDLDDKTVTILAGTGPVGMRIAHLIAGPATKGDNTQVKICSRRLEKAENACQRLKEQFPAGKFIPCQTVDSDQIDSAVSAANVIFSAGAAGIELLDKRWQSLSQLEVAIDLNGVPPLGIAGISALDKAKEIQGRTCYGAIGVGELKMKIHKRAIEILFQSNDQTLEVEEIFAIGENI
jgi:hypothetical protein